VGGRHDRTTRVEYFIFGRQRPEARIDERVESIARARARARNAHSWAFAGFGPVPWRAFRPRAKAEAHRAPCGEKVSLAVLDPGISEQHGLLGADAPVQRLRIRALAQQFAGADDAPPFADQRLEGGRAPLCLLVLHAHCVHCATRLEGGRAPLRLLVRVAEEGGGGEAHRVGARFGGGGGGRREGMGKGGGHREVSGREANEMALGGSVSANSAGCWGRSTRWTR